MPFAIEHRARQRGSDQCHRFRRVKPEGFPPGVEAVQGYKEDGTHDLESIAFDAAKWTPEKAAEWLASNGHEAKLDKANHTIGEPTFEVRLDELPADGAGLRTVRRWDLMPLERATQTAEGFVRGQGMITRAGVFEYTRRDGSLVRELRPPEEVFKADSMQSFALVPLTLNHPPDNLTPESAAKFGVGAIGSPIRIGSHVKADLLITRADAIEAVLGGKNKLSCGYTCQVVDRGGTFVDADQVEHKFDAIQVSIIGNHVAICDNPRAGPSAQIRIDEGDAFADLSKEQPKGDAMKLVKVTINGQTYEVPEDVATKMRADGVIGANNTDKKTDTVVVKPADATAVALAEAQAARDKALGELAAVKAKQDADEAKRKDSESKTDAKEATKARLALCLVAAPVLDKKFDELLDLDEGEIMRAVIAAKAPKVEIEGKSDDFVLGVYNTVAGELDSKVDTVAAITTLMNKGKKTALESKGDNDPQKRADDARQRMVDRQKNAWKPESLRKLEKQTN